VPDTIAETAAPGASELDTLARLDPRNLRVAALGA